MAVRNPMHGNPAKDPKDWITGDEPMTGPQESYLNTLAQEAGEHIRPELSKAEASKKIDELQHKTGRGQRPRKTRTARTHGRTQS